MHLLTLALLLFLASCEEKQEDPSEVENLVLLEEDEEDLPLVPDERAPVAEFMPMPQELIILDEQELEDDVL